MNIKPYDLVAKLIPGFLTILAFYTLTPFPYSESNVLGYTVIAFLIGYLLDALGSWLEPFYFFTWGGKPSASLVQGKKTVFRNWLPDAATFATNWNQKQKSPHNDNQIYKELQTAIKVYSSAASTVRLQEMQEQYALSRSLLTFALALFAGIVCLFLTGLLHKYPILLFSFGGLLLFWYRCYERACYMAREQIYVYRNYWNEKTQQEAATAAVNGEVLLITLPAAIQIKEIIVEHSLTPKAEK